MLRHLLAQSVGEVRILSRDEEKQDALRRELRDPRERFYIGDIRDRDSVDKAMAGVDCVFHAAALKQVPSCEFFPIEAMRTNIQGSENVIRSAIAAGVRSLVCLSTDKAVFPVNAMGLSKAMMEKAAQAAARELGEDARTMISCVRYGNVIYSRGSVVPLFVRQILTGKPITVTDPTMTRFLTSAADCVDLVNHAFDYARPGDLFIRKASASTLADLVEALKEIFDVPDHPVEVIGLRHAEKRYETLASAQEMINSEDLGDYLRIRMDGRDLNYGAYLEPTQAAGESADDYSSHNTGCLSRAEVRDLLLSLPPLREELSAWQSRR